jgi:hypothetical protein
VLIFEGGWLFFITIIPPPSKTSMRTRFRVWFVVFHGYHPTMPENESVCSFFILHYYYSCIKELILILLKLYTNLIENPRVNPYPTHTHVYGYGFAGVRVRVALKNPRVTRAIP